MNGSFPQAALPAAGAIHVWWVDLDAGGLGSADPAAVLTDEELQRAAGFRRSRDASRFRMCRAALRMGLGWYLGQNPREILLDTGARGKPYLSGAQGLFFNVSHSGAQGAIAFTTHGEVGIDVEAAHRVVEAMEIASAYFTRKEAEQIGSEATEAMRIRAFLRIWTRKEAVLKAIGCGIVDWLDRVDVTRDPVSLDAVEIFGSLARWQLWQVRDLTAPDGFQAAIASVSGNWSVEEWNPAWHEIVERLHARFSVVPSPVAGKTATGGDRTK